MQDDVNGSASAMLMKELEREDIVTLMMAVCEQSSLDQ